MNLTDQEMEALKACQSEQEWNSQCDAVKRARKGKAMTTKIKPGRGWRLMRGNEMPHWKHGDEMADGPRSWSITGWHGNKTVAEIIRDRPYILAYRRKLRAKKAKKP